MVEMKTTIATKYDTAAVREKLEQVGLKARVKMGTGSISFYIIITPTERLEWMTEVPKPWIDALNAIGFEIDERIGGVHNTDPIQFIFKKTGDVPLGDPVKFAHKAAYVPRKTTGRVRVWKRQDLRIAKATNRLSKARRAGRNVVRY